MPNTINKIKSKIILLVTDPERFYRILEHKFLRFVFKLKKRPQAYQRLVATKIGLEIGGPSQFFSNKGFIPVYSVIADLDGCNFGTTTIWEGQIREGKTYRYEDKIGQQYICDATDLKQIKSGSYDFLLSCNTIEHIANPLKAVKEWLRVLKSAGILIVVAPRKESNFDHRRPLTSFDHLKLDFKNNIGEDDQTHLEEILKLHDLSLDPDSGTIEQFKQRCLKSAENRALHHHLFDLNLLKSIFIFFDIEVLMTNNIGSDYIIAGRNHEPD